MLKGGSFIHVTVMICDIERNSGNKNTQNDVYVHFTAQNGQLHLL